MGSEIVVLLDEIMMNLKSIMNEYKQVTVQQIEDMFHKIDPLKPQNEVDKYLCAGFGVSMVKSLAKDLLISYDTYFKKLSTILVKRSGLETEKRRKSNMKDVVNMMKSFTKNASI